MVNGPCGSGARGGGWKTSRPGFEVREAVKGDIHVQEPDHAGVPRAQLKCLGVPMGPGAQQDHGRVLQGVRILGEYMCARDHDLQPGLNVGHEGVQIAGAVRVGQPATVLSVNRVVQSAGQQASVGSIDCARVAVSQTCGGGGRPRG